MSCHIAGFCVAASACNTFAILSAAVSVLPCLKKPDTTRTEFPMRISVTQSAGAVLFMLCLICSFLSVIGKLLSIVHQLFQPFHFLLCLFPAEIHAGAADRGTHLCYPVINPLVGCVRGIVQLVKA